MAAHRRAGHDSGLPRRRLQDGTNDTPHTSPPDCATQVFFRRDLGPRSHELPRLAVIYRTLVPGFPRKSLKSIDLHL